MIESEEGQIVKAVVSKHQAGDLEGCIEHARRAKESVKDPSNLGWVYFYEYKSLYELDRFKEAFELFKSITGPKNQLIVMTANNGIWMHSVAMELAFELKDRHSLIDIAEKALQLAASQPDRVKLIESNRTMMLEKLK